MTPLSDRLAAVEERIHHACERAGRDRASVRLVAVTKAVPAEVAAELAELGAGGLLTKEMAFRFPPYRPGGVRGEI